MYIILVRQSDDIFLIKVGDYDGRNNAIIYSNYEEKIRTEKNAHCT